MGIKRCKATASWRMVQRYEYMKKTKGCGKSIVAAARKMAEIVWTMLSDRQDFDVVKMQGKHSPANLAVQARYKLNFEESKLVRLTFYRSF